MQRNIDHSLGELKQKLLRMTGFVEKAINAAIEAWQSRNVESVKDVYSIETQVNSSHIEVDDACLKILATQQPMASDLRLIISIVKINTDLERMVDQAVNIANNAEHYIRIPPAFPTEDLSKMCDHVRYMVRATIDAFIQEDEKLARVVMERDDEVDFLKNKIFKDILAHVKKDPSVIEQGLNLILIARNLERIGDHATNISEDVIFTISGRDVRHQSHKKSGEKS